MQVSVSQFSIVARFQLRRLTDGPDSGRYRWRKPVDGSPVLIKNISHCSGKMHRARFNRLHLFERANRISLESDSARETWLILPVVICLSQRLSHACLSISVSLRNCEWLIKTVIVSMSVVYYLDIHGNSRANTCVQTRLLRKGCAY